MLDPSKIDAFARLLYDEQKSEYEKRWPGLATSAPRESRVTVTTGKKYVRVDVGAAGKYMIDEAGNIFGIKAYGVIHRGHQYGTLDTIHDWYWGGYVATKKV
jgi:hypothetical protein